MTVLQGVPLLEGAAEGPVLRLERPISFWGGIDPTDGRVADPRHPQHGAVVAGQILVLPGTVGSSSSSYIMLELLAGGRAPAAVIVAEPDAILALGVLVAREMGYGGIPVTRLPVNQQVTLRTGDMAQVRPDGAIIMAGSAG